MDRSAPERRLRVRRQKFRFPAPPVDEARTGIDESSPIPTGTHRGSFGHKPLTWALARSEGFEPPTF